MQRILKYLLVEDDDSHALITSRCLRSAGSSAEVARVADGVEAIAYLRHEGPYESSTEPDLVLLDLKLPKMNGHEVLAIMKSDAKLRRIPVVILSTSDAEPDRAKAYDLHANSYLVKPLNFDGFRELASELDKYWGQWNRPACP